MDVLKTILYFSIFNYPVTKDEVLKFSNCKTLEEVHLELENLLEARIIYKFGDYYSKTNNSQFIEKREMGNRMAKKVMPKALKRAYLISQFPFVKGVAFSGAFSKGYFDQDGDIDFFIITEANRLWVARTLLILYKKLFLLNSRKYFCVNYFLSESALKISEQNRFTAMEIATLIPLYGQTHFDLFFKKNNWFLNYFSNISTQDKIREICDIRPAWPKQFVEFTLRSKLGDLWENWFRKITLMRWKSKFPELPDEDFKLAMKSTKDVSKHHPKNYQKKVINSLNELYVQINESHQIVLDPEHA
ncbi:nucleotidyltransferase domain-containing protein [Aestuariivivens sediminis]|uniref:nucleotidyltransferase domain-containing protein n=1 Tax=Aestuariivivens sediminis TaxID=2913557 RepID=UPI001F5AEEE5|nr:nucleotidyltransferase domain-containing protein [Aestuariivivens sediminis]